MNSNPVVWFEIYVDDMPRAKQFYESVLGVPIDHYQCQICMMRILEDLIRVLR